MSTYKNNFLLLMPKKKHRCSNCKKVINSRARKRAKYCSKCNIILRESTEEQKQKRREWNKKYYKYKKKFKNYDLEIKIYEYRQVGLSFSDIAKVMNMSNREVRNAYHKYNYHVNKEVKK